MCLSLVEAEGQVFRAGGLSWGLELELLLSELGQLQVFFGKQGQVLVHIAQQLGRQCIGSDQQTGEQQSSHSKAF